MTMPTAPPGGYVVGARCDGTILKTAIIAPSRIYQISQKG